MCAFGANLVFYESVFRSRRETLAHQKRKLKLKQRVFKLTDICSHR